MFKLLTIAVAAYVLIAGESSLRLSGFSSPYGCFVWLLLPWLATFSSKSGSILAAGTYGLLLDCLGSHHPGIIMALTVLAVTALERLISSASLRSAGRVFVVSFICCILMGMGVATVTIAAEGHAEPLPELVISISLLSLIAALVSSFVTALWRSTLGNMARDQTDPVLS